MTGGDDGGSDNADRTLADEAMKREGKGQSVMEDMLMRTRSIAFLPRFQWTSNDSLTDGRR